MSGVLINREALFRAWDKIEVDGKDPNLIIDEMVQAAQDAPYVMPSEIVKHGEWIPVEIERSFGIFKSVKCSRCNKVYIGIGKNFCSECGANNKRRT